MSIAAARRPASVGFKRDRGDQCGNADDRKLNHGEQH
jgi:hypothetical protein